MAKIRLPNGWTPRPYQLEAWNYLERGGKHAELIWHRRSGKDEIALHRTAVAAFERQATYWHMLPLAVQARKAIWDAINPHSGKRRIDEAFPHELRSATKDHEMMIRFKNGSTWQVVGSDNYNSLVGSPPAGVVFSEWALANPSARAYLRPIFAENNGWQMYITTPRGKNHAYKTYTAGLKDPGTFAQKLSAYDTGSISVERLAAERQAYIDDYGTDRGISMFEQEYLCSFDAALLGAYYGGEMRLAEDQKRIRDVPHTPGHPVHSVWDLGYSDDTAIWFYQLVGGELRIIDYLADNGKDVQSYAEYLYGRKIVVSRRDDRTGEIKAFKLGEAIEHHDHRLSWEYGNHWLPHDAAPETLAANGRSILQQLYSMGIKGRLVPGLSVQDGIQAVRKVLPRCFFDEQRCDLGIESLKQYQREWDDDKKTFREKPRHDWTSHGADAFRYLALVWKDDARDVEPPKPRFLHEMTANEVFWPSKTGPQQRTRF